ncbi:MAG: preprotein translocase subunit YajC [Synergistaceae bacterium]|jgi:preprotein translocase subunit YajC|nr:preprotein translocase subunit YajC [Synergistaceae bacterium]
MNTGQATPIYAAMLLILLLLLFFGFLRPEAQAKKAKKSLQDSLKVGDRVFTQAGVHGVITAVNGDLVLLEVGAAKTELEVARWAILSIDGHQPESACPINTP